jgi:shikimate kinase
MKEKKNKYIWDKTECYGCVDIHVSRILYDVDFCNYKPYTSFMADKVNSAFIFLGIKHSGKSTQGRLLAEKLGCPFFDTDDIIVEQTGSSVRDLYMQKGPGAFLSAEESVCAELAEKFSGKRMVVSTGGGICDNAPALEQLRGLGIFIFIKTPEKTACDRIIRKAVFAQNDTVMNIPAYIAKKNPHTEEDVRTFFHDFYVERTALYEKIADITVDLADAPKEENLSRIVTALGL